NGDSYVVRINYWDNQRLFYAEAKKSADPTKLVSKVFDSLEAYSQFIHYGVSSYAPSIYGDALTKIDLIKEDPVYESLDAKIDFSWLDGAWRDTGLEFDCAVHVSSGGQYKWTYQGLKSELK
ncbi:MAG: hypothetical protein WBX38_08890, partial [Candidatus Sulfotelmatobacter sp.]